MQSALNWTAALGLFCAVLIPKAGYADEHLWIEVTDGDFIRLLSADRRGALDANGGKGTPYLSDNLDPRDNLRWKKENAGGGWFRLRPKVRPEVALDAGVGRNQPFFQDRIDEGNPNLRWIFTDQGNDKVALVSLAARHRALDTSMHFFSRLRLLEPYFGLAKQALKRRLSSVFEGDDRSSVNRIVDEAYRLQITQKIEEEEEKEDEGESSESVSECMDRKAEERGHDRENYRWACIYEEHGQDALDRFVGFVTERIIDQGGEEWKRRIEKPVSDWAADRERALRDSFSSKLSGLTSGAHDALRNPRQAVGF